MDASKLVIFCLQLTFDISYSVLDNWRREFATSILYSLILLQIRCHQWPLSAY